ncbi:MAG: glutamine synthetase [Lachnospiraceae bacterium]|nr:glutamine synthetase [Lachnospiraceae bacterium]
MTGYTEQEAIEYVEENDVKFIRLAFCDIFGHHKNISILPGELKKAFDVGIAFDPKRVMGYDDPVFLDLLLLPDPATLSILPWRSEGGAVIRFYCDIITSDGSPFLYDARSFLKNTIAQCKSMGFTCRMGIRSEFYLFRADDYGNPTDIPWDNGGYLDIAPLDKGENIRREICLCLEEMGLRPETSHHESGPGQNEIDFKQADALRTADHFITYKNVVTSVASRNGAFASFAPMPIEGKSGNGLHLSIELFSGDTPMEESNPDMAESFMAGVLNRMRDITVFLNTSRESYLRFGENEAPKYITWSAQNKSRLMRVPVERGKKSGFILRSPDSGLNPYLAFGMIIQAGLCGIKKGEKLPPPVDKSIRLCDKKERESFGKLPLSLNEAIEWAKSSEFIRQPGIYELAGRFLELVG